MSDSKESIIKKVMKFSESDFEKSNRIEEEVHKIS
jgi:hypothetical protein